MNKFLKKILCAVTSLACVTACFGLSACEDIKTMEVKLSANGTEYTMSVELYRHLAPETCKIIEKYVAEGYYDGSLIYKNDSFGKQLMVGDLVLDGKNVKQSAAKPEIYGEFEKNGTTGSNLVSEKGSIGLWRSWTAFDASDSKYKASNGMDSGMATWFIPTDAISEYNGYFCVFATYDKTATANSEAIDALGKVFDSSDNYTEYVIYYTGVYDAAKSGENYGLEFHCVTKSDYESVDKDTVFEAKNEQLVRFNKQNVKISENTKIVSVKLK